MIIMLFSAVLLIISTLFFSFSYSIQGLNKSVIYAPIELMFKDVSIDSSGAKLEASKVKEHLLNYYQSTLTKYCKSFEASFYFYNSIDESMCLDKYCDAVDVTINAVTVLNYQYHRVMFYELKRGIING